MSELEEYKSQLRDIEETIKQEPDNESLKELRKELQDLIALLSQDGQPEETQTSKQESPILTEDDKEVAAAVDLQSPTPSIPDFKVGDVVYVKNRLDKEYKEVKITTISGNKKLITVKFDDDKVDTFPLEEIHKTKPKFVVNKYRQKQQKKENQQKKDKELENTMNKSVQSWKNFNKKPKKKALNEKSQFSTSDSVGSKVGVVNSGKPMTENKKRERTVHRYNPY